ncbi:probable glutamate carboxypeptidase AMP1 [Glycine soja]|uniref:glutamate carboxypeptidase II n=1 Tax=Glycine soja TaxID=3848 RepID=A0A445LES4_GLYSO|nr:probable glutamate carboxypeptidase AMP1 [Glycine soja]RZC21662.1 putative glutamate carboxypeptidase AMP1 isoform A [Glycine soja]
MMPKQPMNVLTTKPSPLSTMVVMLILCILGFYALHFPHSSTPSENLSHLEKLFLSTSSNSTISSYLRALTMHPHLAGTKPASDTTRYVLNHFTSLGLSAHTTTYTTLLSFPVRSSLSAHFNDGSSVSLRLTEEASGAGVVAAYHAYSPSGAVHAPAVFANYGRQRDYRALAAMGVNVSGCVVVVRKGGEMGRGAVVERAEVNGAAAVLVYGEGDTWRKGFERGHVMRGGIGDPLTPGWAGVEGAETLGLEDREVLKRFPKIPSMPLSAEVADTILSSLGGVHVPLHWRGTLRSKVRHVGPGPTLLNFTYEGEKKVATIQNVFAVIKGSEEPDRYVLLGNHRDAWTYGAVDPSSGTAALLDIARRFSALLGLGWKPRRTIILCSWDAEEFGMIGSTEWVEQNLINLGSKAVAYLNVDCAVQGPDFFVGSTPQLDNLILEVTNKVKDPDSDGVSLYENWAAGGGGNNIQRLSGVDSDFAPFVQHAGVPSIDMYYGRDFPVYHTAFDSYNWMAEYGDPFFHRHVAVTGVWGLLALHLANDPILPFNYVSYANELQLYKNTLSNLIDQKISLHPLTLSIEEFASAAKEADDEIKKLRLQETEGCFVDMKKRALNDRLMLAEKGFLDADGLQGKQWFKHLVFGPSSDHERINFFPGISDSTITSAGVSERERLASIQHEIWRVARAIRRAASALRGEFT